MTDRPRTQQGVHVRLALGAQLFLSLRTFEWHLTKVFGKLGISSRKQLRSALSDVGQPSSAPSSHSDSGLEWRATGATESGLTPSRPPSR
jgi:hypothetical protein